MGNSKAGHLAVWAGISVLWVVGCTNKNTAKAPSQDEKHQTARFIALSDQELDEIEPMAVGFCGNCHAAPNPLSFTRQEWPREVQRGFDFYSSSGRSDLRVPKNATIRAYYQSLAPEHFPPIKPSQLDTTGRQLFQWTNLKLENKVPSAFAGAGVASVDLGTFGRGLLVSDMRSGSIFWMKLGNLDLSNVKLSEVAKLRNPGRIRPADFNSDGKLDLLVGDLGSFLPEDHQFGRVLWLEPKSSDTLEFDVTEVLVGCGRVADVNSADFDGDGDLDLVVADFGWHETGQVVWLERVAIEIGVSSFKPHVVDSRPGALQVSIADLDGDGDQDFITLLAQEFEMIIAYINDGQGSFTSHTVYEMGDPAAGSSGMELVDLDADGDLDIVHTNGDSFDSFHVKPYHAIRWQENLGNLSYGTHLIATMPGVHRASPTDLDADGDIDLVAVAYLPPQVLGEEVGGLEFEAITWFENDGHQNFSRRPLKVGQATHATVLTEDITGDGRIDIVAPCFYDAGTDQSVDLDVGIARQ